MRIPLVVALLTAAMAVLGTGVPASFTGGRGTTATFGAPALDGYVPASVSASRLDPSTCRVTWTASATPNPPSGLHYDVTDGTSTRADQRHLPHDQRHRHERRRRGTGLRGRRGDALHRPRGPHRRRRHRWERPAGRVVDRSRIQRPGRDHAVHRHREPQPAWTWTRVPFGWGDGGFNSTRQFYKGGFNATVNADLGSYSALVTDGTWGSAPTIAGSEFTSSSHTLWTAGRRPGGTSGVLWPNTATTSGTIGKNPNSGSTDYWYGPIPEVIVLNTTITAPERRQVEEYLARKWNSVITPQAPATAPTVAAGDGLDGADTSTMFQDTGATTGATTAGQPVARWNDKSGQGGSVQQATSGNQPTLATVNGRPVPKFDGTNDWLSLGTISQLPSGTNPSTEIAVAASNDATPASNGQRTVFEHGANATGQSRAMYKAGGSSTFVADTYSSGYTARGSVSASPLIAVAQFSSPTVSLATAGSSPSTGSSSFTTSTSYADVGRESTSGLNWNGPIPELIVLNTTVTTAERRSIEEYLSRKWASPITPSQPTGPSATPGNASASVSWTPGYDGAATVTYTATASTGGSAVSSCTATEPATSCTINGLTNGTTYSVVVTPSNSAGTGAASSAVSVTPRTVPGAPTAVTLTPGNAQLGVSWTAPASNGGSAITGYTASTNTGVTCTSASTSCNLTGLTNGTTYTVTVYATNAAGNGAASAAASGTPPLANAGFETGTLVGWSCPTPADDSIVTSPTHGGTSAVKATYVNPDKAHCSQTVSGLTGGATYTFRIWVNGTGLATVGYAAGGNSGWTGNSASGSWTQLTVSVPVPSGVTTATVYFETQGTVTFDDATLS